MKNRGFLSLLILLLLVAPTAGAVHYEYGLRIRTYPSTIKDATGLLLEGGKAISLGGDPFRMDFEINNRDDNLIGTVFRMITDRGDNIDLMYSVDREGHHYPILVTGEYVHDIRSALTTGKWMGVSIRLDPRSGEVTLDYGGTLLQVKDAGAKGAKSVRIAFGHCHIPGFQLDDVASLSLRDIYLSRDGRRFRHWDLSVHDGDNCFDNLKGAPATAVNPSWLVDRYISWDEVFTKTFSREPSVAFDPAEVFYMSADGSVISVYDCRTRESRQIEAVAGAYPAHAPNQLIWNGSRLVSYNLDECTEAFFNPERKAWEGGELPSKDHNYWNNAATWWEREQAVVSFGGYGHYHYNNDLLIQRCGSEGTDRQYRIEEITPRYGCAVAIVSDEQVYNS